MLLSEQAWLHQGKPLIYFYRGSIEWLAAILCFTIIFGFAAYGTKAYGESAVSPTSQNSNHQEQYFIGRAYDADNPEILLYTETYVLSFSPQGRPLSSTVTYQKPSQPVMAIKTLDYSIYPSQPLFHIRNWESGLQLGVRLPSPDGVVLPSSEKTLEIFYQKGTNAPFKSQLFDLTPQTVIDGGFHFSILEHWQRLLAGETVEIIFMTPSRQRGYKIDVKLVPEKEGTSAKSRQVQFLFAAHSRFVRWFSKPILLTYGQESQRLLIYEGSSNIRDAQGKPYQVRIEYDYSINTADMPPS